MQRWQAWLEKIQCFGMAYLHVGFAFNRYFSMEGVYE
jgi:hypothetical protein